MSTSFDCQALRELRAAVAEADQSLGRVQVFTENAKQARTDASAAEAAFTRSLSDSDGAEALRLSEIATAAERLAKLAAGGSPSKRREAMLDHVPLFELARDAAVAREAAIRATLVATREILAAKVAQDIRAGDASHARSCEIDRVRVAIRSIDGARQEAADLVIAAEQRIGWISAGRNPMQGCFRSDLTIDGFMGFLTKPLPTVWEEAPAVAIPVEVVPESQPPQPHGEIAAAHQIDTNESNESEESDDE